MSTFLFLMEALILPTWQEQSKLKKRIGCKECYSVSLEERLLHILELTFYKIKSINVCIWLFIKTVKQSVTEFKRSVTLLWDRDLKFLILETSCLMNYKELDLKFNKMMSFCTNLVKA